MHKSLLSLAAAAALAAPASAQAASVHFEGPEGSEVLVVTAAPGERNVMSVQDLNVDQAARFYDAGVTWTVNTPYCTKTTNAVVCPVPNGYRVEAGDGDDWITVLSGVVEPATILGGSGNDRLETGEANDRLDGGEGDDRLHGYAGDDLLEGGAGNDLVDGYSGRDTVRGGDGDDNLQGDGYEAAAADVVDGGAGTDTIDADYSTRLTGDVEPNVAFTLAGGADDGRPGEGDDVRSVERLVLSKAGTISGTEGSDYVKLHQVGDDGVLIGNGGADELRGGDGRDRIDGGEADDRLDGGFGDDTITGGPGRDTISADLAGGDCGPAWCKQPFGNDTVQARDGEADSISCGAGTDRVVADPTDVVAADCETVERAGVPVDPGADGAAGSPGAKKAALSVVRPGRLRAALRAGLTARLTGFAAGRTAVTVRARGKLVAKSTVTVGRSGKATARLRFTRAARRSLARRRAVTLIVKAGPASRSVTIRR